MDDIRKRLFGDALRTNPVLPTLQWRLEIEQASRTNKNSFKPKVMMNLGVKDQQHIIYCDFANLKNLNENLQNALKMHAVGKFSAAKKSSV